MKRRKLLKISLLAAIGVQIPYIKPVVFKMVDTPYLSGIGREIAAQVDVRLDEGNADTVKDDVEFIISIDGIETVMPKLDFSEIGTKEDIARGFEEASKAGFWKREEEKDNDFRSRVLDKLK